MSNRSNEHTVRVVGNTGFQVPFFTIFIVAKGFFAPVFASWSWWWVLIPWVPVIVETVKWLQAGGLK